MRPYRLHAPPYKSHAIRTYYMRPTSDTHKPYSYVYSYSYAWYVLEAAEFLEVVEELLALVALCLAVLDRVAAQEVVQLHRLDRRRAILVLSPHMTSSCTHTRARAYKSRVTSSVQHTQPVTIMSGQVDIFALFVCRVNIYTRTPYM